MASIENDPAGEPEDVGANQHIPDFLPDDFFSQVVPPRPAVDTESIRGLNDLFVARCRTEVGPFAPLFEANPASLDALRIVDHLVMARFGNRDGKLPYDISRFAALFGEASTQGNARVFSLVSCLCGERGSAALPLGVTERLIKDKPGDILSPELVTSRRPWVLPRVEHFKGPVAIFSSVRVYEPEDTPLLDPRGAVTMCSLLGEQAQDEAIEHAKTLAIQVQRAVKLGGPLGLVPSLVELTPSIMVTELLEAAWVAHAGGDEAIEKQGEARESPTDFMGLGLHSIDLFADGPSTHYVGILFCGGGEGFAPPSWLSKNYRIELDWQRFARGGEGAKAIAVEYKAVG